MLGGFGDEADNSYTSSQTVAQCNQVNTYSHMSFFDSYILKCLCCRASLLRRTCASSLHIARAIAGALVRLRALAGTHRSLTLTGVRWPATTRGTLAPTLRPRSYALTMSECSSCALLPGLAPSRCLSVYHVYTGASVVSPHLSPPTDLSFRLPARDSFCRSASSRSSSLPPPPPSRALSSFLAGMVNAAYVHDCPTVASTVDYSHGATGCSIHDPTRPSARAPA